MKQTKAELAHSILMRRWRYDMIVGEYMTKGYTEDVAIQKAEAWYIRNYTKNELLDMASMIND